VDNTADIGTEILDVNTITKHSTTLNLIPMPSRSGGCPQVCSIQKGVASHLAKQQSDIELAVKATILALLPHLTVSESTDYYDATGHPLVKQDSSVFFWVKVFFTTLLFLITVAMTLWLKSGRPRIDEGFELVDADAEETQYNAKFTNVVRRVDSENKCVRTVATQAQVTYMRKWQQPRFQCLADRKHGCFGEQIG
jgi:hypothetical protein